MWDLLLNEDETLIADSVREFLAAELPIERLRPDAADLDESPKTTSQIARDSGLTNAR